MYTAAPPLPHLSCSVTVLLSRVSLCVSGALLKKKKKPLSSRHRIRRNPWRGVRGRGDFFFSHPMHARSLRIVVAVALCVYIYAACILYRPLNVDCLLSSTLLPPTQPARLIVICSGVVIAIAATAPPPLTLRARSLPRDIDTSAVATGVIFFCLNCATVYIYIKRRWRVTTETTATTTIYHNDMQATSILYMMAEKRVEKREI